MKKYLKKSIMVLMSIVMLSSIVPLANLEINVSAGVYYDEVYTEGIFTYVLTRDSKAIIYKCNDDSIIEVDIPSQLGGYPVISLGYIPFSPEGGAPDGINGTVFSDCSALKKITIPDSVTNIEPGTFDGTAFYNDESNWENGLLYIDDYLVAVKDGQTEYIIKDGTKRMFWGAFDGRNDVNSVVLNKELEYIPELTFRDCANINEIIIPEGVTDLGNMSFGGCKKLADIVISNSVIRIKSYAFYDCVNLTKVIIPDSVVSVASSAFEGCTGLENVTIGNGVANIGIGAFDSCFSLIDVYYNGTEEEWNNIIIEEYNDALLNATIHFNNTHEHTLVHDIVPSTCKVAGMEYDFCSECGETFNAVTLPLNAHTWGEWNVTTQPTGTSEGISTRVCSVCGEEETKSIPKLGVMKDEETGIEIEFDDEYESGVEIKVEQVFDGDSFRLIENAYGNINSEMYDISTIKDGVKVQPDGKVKVRIPLPKGFGSSNIFVCYVDSINGTVTNIPATVVDGYVEFEAEHFSYYAVVEKLDKVNSVSINNIEMNYKDSTTITPAIDVDEGVEYTVTYSSSDNSVAQVDENGNVYASGKGETTITCTVTDEYGNTVTDTCDIEVKYTWWQWIIVIVLFGWIWY